MKKILLHGPAVDNVGGYHDAGSELGISDTAKPSLITSDRADRLIARRQAVKVAVSGDSTGAAQAKAGK